jgi:hypothetical protein
LIWIYFFFFLSSSLIPQDTLSCIGETNLR